MTNLYFELPGRPQTGCQLPYPFSHPPTAMDPTDFLIRSATSLLSIIDQQPEQPSSASYDRSVRFLDRIALLLVTKSKDISAVSAVLAGNDSILVSCTESSTDSSEDDSNPDYSLVPPKVDATRCPLSTESSRYALPSVVHCSC